MITPTTPATIPATTAVTANAVWIKSLNITAPSLTGKISCRVSVRQYNDASNVFVGPEKSLYVPDVMAAAAATSNGAPTAEATAIQAAMAAIYAAIQAIGSAQGAF